MSTATDSDVLPEDAATELIEVAERKRRAVRKPLRPAAELAPVPGAVTKPQRVGSDDGGAEDEEDASVAEEPNAKPASRPKPRRKLLRAAKAGVFPAMDGEHDDVVAEGPGNVTRGIHAGLSGLAWTKHRAVRLGLWGIAAAVVVTSLVVGSFYAIGKVPAPLPVSNFRIAYLPGPKLPQAEVFGWLRAFPQRDKLVTGSPEVLEQLGAYLRKQSVVAEVRQVTVVHEPDVRHADKLQRTLEVVMALRRPVMPVVLATGERAWVDAEGWLLPGTLPGPTQRRPVLRDIEWGGIDGVRAALALWQRIEPQIEPGLVTDIRLHDYLDAKGLQRGIVLYTRQGSRLIWGRPNEERYGVRPEDKARDLVHTIRCQGNLGRVAAINVRFKQPFFVLRDAPQ